MSLTDVLEFFFTFLTMILLSTAVVFLGRPVRCLLLSMPAVSFFFRTFQVVVRVIPNACAMALIDYPSFLSVKITLRRSAHFIIWRRRIAWHGEGCSAFSGPKVLVTRENSHSSAAYGHKSRPASDSF